VLSAVATCSVDTNELVDACGGDTWFTIERTTRVLLQRGAGDDTWSIEYRIANQDKQRRRVVGLWCVWNLGCHLDSRLLTASTRSRTHQPRKHNALKQCVLLPVVPSTNCIFEPHNVLAIAIERSTHTHLLTPAYASSTLLPPPYASHTLGSHDDTCSRGTSTSSESPELLENDLARRLLQRARSPLAHCQAVSLSSTA
jgi:hypothetical protein